MLEQDDHALLREYAERGSEEAFGALVARHVNKVYSAALRHTGNPHHAEEITQAVFVILARKSGRLGKRVILEGWLYQTARLTAITFIRSEIRRARREAEALMQNVSDENESEVWAQIAPLLDTAMAGLPATDRHAVVLRFFYGKSMREIGTALGGSEGAARLRLHRAVEKLRQFFLKRGIASTTEMITGAMTAHCVQTAPAALTKAATAAALAKGATGSPSILTLTKGAMKLMAWANVKTALAAGAAFVLVAGVTTTLVAQRQDAAASPARLASSEWQYAGFGTPAAALQTLAWSVKHTNATAMFNCLSDDCQREFREVVALKTPNLSAEEFLLGAWSRQLTGVSAMRILKTEEAAPDQVLLDLALEGGGLSGDRWIKMQKFGTKWKLDDFDPKGPNGRTGFEPPNAEYGGVGLVVDYDARNKAMRIRNSLPDSPAAQAGLLPGTLVQKINGTPTAGQTLAQCVFLTRGRVGTKVTLELYNPDSKQTTTVELTRAKLTP